MRTTHVLFLSCLFACPVILTGCASSTSSDPAPSASAESKLPEPGTGTSPKAYLTDYRPIEADGVVMTVHGLGCPLCAENINKTLADVPGVANSTVDMSTGAVAVDFKAGAHPSRADLAKSIVDSGFTLVSIQTIGVGG